MKLQDKEKPYQPEDLNIWVEYYNQQRFTQIVILLSILSICISVAVIAINLFR